MKNLYLIAIVSLLFSCKGEIKNVIIDNPTTEQVRVQFGEGDTYIVEAEEKIDVPVEFGNNKVSINGEEPEKIYLDSDKEYLINPTKETYYIENLMYFYSQSVKDKYESEFGVSTTEVEGHTLNGSFDKIESELVIPKSWTFGLDKNPSGGGSASAGNSKGYVKVRKIHRKKDLLATIGEEWDKALDEIIKKIESEK